MSNRAEMIKALKSHAQGHIDKHKMNVEVYLNNSVGIGEHPDVLEAIEKEIAVIATYMDELEVLNRYFPE
ncbi:MAG: hypothetical protein CMP43_02930 [Rickettsiales bacterium]|jgi:hypothetical protein|nr:hypothetical protein [Rickettsiales bacterium]|tara:strand:+ start:375 stop:584 length:210 start_codon:yes stop_codon:yes gene_type:complete